MFVVKIFANAPLCSPFCTFLVRIKDKRGRGKSVAEGMAPLRGKEGGMSCSLKEIYKISN